MTSVEMIPWAYTQMMLDGARSQGFNSENLLASAQIASVAHGQPLDATDFVRLMRVVTTALDDEMMGLLQQPQRLGYFALACGYASHAQTLREAQCRLLDTLSLMDNSLQYRQRQHGGEVLLLVERQPEQTVRNDLVIELVLMLLHRFTSWLGGGNLGLLSVALDYPKPSNNDSRMQWFGKASQVYSSPNSLLSYSLGALQTPVLRSEAEATAWARRTPLDALLPSSVGSELGQQVADWLTDALRQNNELPDMGSAASAHGLSTHTLRRRLQLQGSDYLQLRNQVRRDHAIKLLNTTEHSVEYIATQLGFSEASAFVRAFRGWTGLTPRLYRLGETAKLSQNKDPQPRKRTI